MVYVIVLVLLFGIIWVVGGPLLRSNASVMGATETPDPEQLRRSERRIDVEAARDAKYREIRDAELDHQTGKLSDEDFRATDGTLRTEAMRLLRELDTIDELDARAASAESAEAGSLEPTEPESADDSELDERPTTPTVE